jgi:hypothetical protein
MNRNEAVIYLKELLTRCSEMSPNAVSFEEQRKDNTVNVRLHIQGSIGEIEKQVVHELAQKHSLQVKDNTEGVIIYNTT